MSHKIYTTEAIVVGSRANNTSDKSFLLFTRDAGMLWASARSVREERSRQRYALQDFSLIRASLVQGKGGWRIGSVEGVRNYFKEAGDAVPVPSAESTEEVDITGREARGAVTAVIRLLRQYVHGEGASPDLFADVKTALEQSAAISSKEERERLIEVFTLRLLHTLGYIAKSSALEPYLTDTKWWQLPALPPAICRQVENAKQFSHL